MRLLKIQRPHCGEMSYEVKWGAFQCSSIAWFRVGVFMLESCGDELTRQGQCSHDAWFREGVFRLRTMGTRS